MRQWQKLGLALLALAIGYLAHRSRLEEAQPESTLPFHYDDSEQAWRDSRYVLAGLNDTLGFGKVYVINMEHRSDRRGQMVKMANRSAIELSFSPGVLVKSRQETLTDAFPSYTPADMPLSKLGCYKAHSNVWRSFIESSSADSALILEDDVDWDVDVKDVLTRLRYPLRAMLARLSGSSPTKMPWNVELWDILRLGTCREPAFRSDFKPRDVDLDALPYMTYVDPTVPFYEWIVTDSRMTFDAYGVPMPSYRSEGGEPRLRLVQKSNYPVCLHAYAVSRAGAKKLLDITARGLVDGANDLTIAEATQQGDLRSFTVLPPPFGQWKVQGWAGNTDNGGTNIDPLIDETGPKAFTWNLRNSARSSLEES